MAAILHDVVGLLHAAMAIYYAYLDRAPVLVLGATGPMDDARRRPRIDWIHTAQRAGQRGARLRQVGQPADRRDGVPEHVRARLPRRHDRAAGPGLPVLRRAAPGGSARPRRSPLPDPTGRARRRAIAADPGGPRAKPPSCSSRPSGRCILAEYLGRDPDAVPRRWSRLAETLAVPVIDIDARLNFPNRHPLNLTATDVLERRGPGAGARRARPRRPTHATGQHRRARSSDVPARLHRSWRSASGDLEHQQVVAGLQQFSETDLSILADTSLAVPALTRAVRGGSTRSRDASARLSAARRGTTRDARGGRARWQERGAERLGRAADDDRRGWRPRSGRRSRTRTGCSRRTRCENWTLTPVGLRPAVPPPGQGARHRDPDRHRARRGAGAPGHGRAGGGHPARRRPDVRRGRAVGRGASTRSRCWS